jgi:hypothetical protein
MMVSTRGRVSTDGKPSSALSDQENNGKSALAFSWSLPPTPRLLPLDIAAATKVVFKTCLTVIFAIVLSEKTTHPLESEPGSVSPRAHKKRRTEAFAAPKQETDVSAENQIEEELALALNPTNAESQEDINGNHDAGDGATDPEVAAVTRILDRGERVEEQYALDQQPAATSGQPASKGLTFVKASLHLKIQSLPILDNLVCGTTYLSFTLPQ